MTKARVRRSTFDVWQFFIWIFLLWTIGSSQAVNECCSERNSWNGSLYCTDGNPINLFCRHGSFMIDPDTEPSDNFTIVNGQLTFYNDENFVSEDKFCLTTWNGRPIAIICFEKASDHPSRYILFGFLSIVSVLFLLLTILVYAILPELRDLQGKAMLSAITSLAGAYLILGTQQLLPTLLLKISDHMCLILAFTLYYMFLSAFFWLNVVAFNVWRSVWFKHFAIKDKTLFIIFCLIGWGAPACFFVAILIAQHTEGQHINPGIGEASCWFSGQREKWAYFYGPVAFLLTLNVIYFGMTSWRLWHEYRAYTGSRLRVLRFKCLLYLKLFLVMGVTWIFEVTSFASGVRNDSYWIPTDVLNSLQGVIIFLLLVVSRKRVKKLLAKKKPCGIVFPKSWTAGVDEECEVVLPEELELSQSA